ncbi:MAG: hypothetical protein EBZ89_11395, partial [Chloroflexi bacterium]|nr:hypothetical protein [Chloroflexota bacterium]
EWWGDAPPATGTNQRMDQIKAWNDKYPNLQVKYGANAATGQGVEALEKFVATIEADIPMPALREPPTKLRREVFPVPAD